MLCQQKASFMLNSFTGQLGLINITSLVMCFVLFLLDSLPHTGVYGNVLRVKILFNKKDSALVEFAHPEQANNGSVDCFNSVFLLVISTLYFVK